MSVEQGSQLDEAAARIAKLLGGTIKAEVMAVLNSGVSVSELDAAILNEDGKPSLGVFRVKYREVLHPEIMDTDLVGPGA